MSEAIMAFGRVEPRGLTGLPEHLPRPSADAFWDLLDRLAGVIWALSDAVWTAGITHTPALALGLGLVAAIPVLLLVGLVIRARGPGRGHEAGDRTRSWSGSATAGSSQGGQASNEHEYGASEGTDAGAGHATMAWRNPTRPPAAMLLRVLDGDPEAGREVPLGDLRVLRIGREADNDVCLRDPTVHRYHAVISRSADDGVVVSDLSGRTGNGVVLNGARISTHPLCDGDRLTLGRAELLVVMS